MPSSYLLLNGLRVHYLHWNLGSGRRAVVLLHGLASNARIWDQVAPRLADANLTVYALDARGHGLTDKPEDGYDFEAFTRDLLAFIATQDIENPVLVGHSWGGLVALDYATRFSFGPRAPAGLVLVDGGFTQLSDLPDGTWEVISQRLAPPNLAGMKLDDFLTLLQSYDPRWQPDDQAVQAILANFELSEEELIRPRLSFERHMQILRAIWEYRTSERFDQVDCPVLMVPAAGAEPHSEEEVQFLDLKRRGVALAEGMMKDIQVHWMADTVHDIPLQRPGQLAEEMVRFIASLP